jgi:hypothetical protein
MMRLGIRESLSATVSSAQPTRCGITSCMALGLCTTRFADDEGLRLEQPTIQRQHRDIQPKRPHGIEVAEQQDGFSRTKRRLCLDHQFSSELCRVFCHGPAFDIAVRGVTGQGAAEDRPRCQGP